MKCLWDTNSNRAGVLKLIMLVRNIVRVQPNPLVYSICKYIKLRIFKEFNALFENKFFFNSVLRQGIIQKTSETF